MFASSVTQIQKSKMLLEMNENYNHKLRDHKFIFVHFWELQSDFKVSIVIVGLVFITVLRPSSG